MNDHSKLDYLQQLAKDGSINRRDFMSGALAFGVSATLASSAWTSIAAAAPRRGGHLHIGASGGALIDTLDPMLAIGTDHVTNTALLCYDTLTEVDSNGTPVPCLAESWDNSKDGRTWKFNLQKGAEFHNGKSVTADDVIWSFNLHLSEKSKCPECTQIVSNFEEFKSDGKDAIVIVQKEINSDLPIHLTSMGLLIGPEGTTNWDAGVGSGPYMLEQYDPGVRFLGKRHLNFYRDDQGYFDSVEIVNIADAGSRSTALRTGAVDVIGEPDKKTAGRLGEVEGISLLEVPGGQHYTTAMRTDTDPFTDNNIRLAVKYGIKRQQVVDSVFSGFGYVGNDHPVARGMQFFSDTLPQRGAIPESW